MRHAPELSGAECLSDNRWDRRGYMGSRWPPESSFFWLIRWANGFILIPLSNRNTASVPKSGSSGLPLDGPSSFKMHSWWHPVKQKKAGPRRPSQVLGGNALRLEPDHSMRGLPVHQSFSDGSAQRSTRLYGHG